MTSLQYMACMTTGNFSFIGSYFHLFSSCCTMKLSEFWEFYRSFHVVSLLICEWAGHDGLTSEMVNKKHTIRRRLPNSSSFFLFFFLASFFFCLTCRPHQYIHPHSPGRMPSEATFAGHSFFPHRRLMPQIRTFIFFTSSFKYPALNTVKEHKASHAAHLPSSNSAISKVCSYPTRGGWQTWKHSPCSCSRSAAHRAKTPSRSRPSREQVEKRW